MLCCRRNSAPRQASRPHLQPRPQPHPPTLTLTIVNSLQHCGPSGLSSLGQGSRQQLRAAAWWFQAQRLAPNTSRVACVAFSGQAVPAAQPQLQAQSLGPCHTHLLTMAYPCSAAQHGSTAGWSAALPWSVFSPFDHTRTRDTDWQGSMQHSANSVQMPSLPA